MGTRNLTPIACPRCGIVSNILNVKGIYTCIGPESCPVYTFEYNHKKRSYGPIIMVGPEIHLLGTPLERRIIEPLPLISKVKVYATEHKGFMELLK